MYAMNNNNNYKLALFSIMLAFFAMGFVDLVGIATNYVKRDFLLSDTVANLFPSMVFFWFFIFSVPTGMLMNRVGRKNTTLLGLVVTTLALVIPFINYSFVSMLISFSFLGIGNTLLQVAINPLLSNVISGNKLASYFTFGQFVKAIASFSAPVLAAWAMLKWGEWKFLFLLFMAFAVVASLLLGFTKIEEQKNTNKNSTFFECIALLKNKYILLSFLGIMCHVGIDVGINVTAPKILIERLSISLEEAAFAASVYFLFRTIGSFSGAFILARFSAKKFFAISALLIFIGVLGLFFVNNMTIIYVCLALIGYGNSNIFPIILSEALLYMPSKKNEVSGLMIMGLFGGTIFPLLMGTLSDTLGSQIGAVIILLVGAVYLSIFVSRLKTNPN
jgi:fucose permease